MTWHNPDTPYTGPVTADLSQTDLTLSASAIAKFWADALTHDRQAMRDRWAQYRGLVPGVLAGAIITDIEAKEIG